MIVLAATPRCCADARPRAGFEVEYFSFATLQTLSSVIGPFVSQNVGAGRLERVRQSFRVSGYFPLAIVAGLSIV